LPWLYAIARYKVVDAFRRRGNRIHLPIEDFAETLESAMTEEPMVAHDSETLLAQLDPRSAGIVRAISLEGETAGIVGKRLGISEGAVRVALHRAMKRMALHVRRDER
jgi:RNA polymerase sigma-70 factor (ECF subfamily)